MKLFLLLPQFLILLFLAVDLCQQLESPRLLGPELENILQSLAGVTVGVIVDVLARQSIPVINLTFAAPVFDAALQSESGGIVRLNLQSLLQFLEGERIFLLLKSRPRGIEQLRKGLATDRAVEAAARRPNGIVHVAFGLKLAKNFARKLKVSFFKSLGGTLKAGPSTLGIKKLDGLVAQRFVERVAEIPRARETMPRLLRHRFVQHTADGLAYRGIQFCSQGRDLTENCLDYLVGAGALERVAACPGLVANDAERKNIGGGRQGPQFDLLGRHVEQRPPLRPRGGGIGHISPTRGDDLHRVVFHHEDVARL